MSENRMQKNSLPDDSLHIAVGDEPAPHVLRFHDWIVEIVEIGWRFDRNREEGAEMGERFRIGGAEEG